MNGMNKSQIDMEEKKDFPFTDNELCFMIEKPVPSKDWMTAFSIYNLDSKNKRLSPNCRPCYFKVFAYLLKIRLNAKNAN
jgi:hypothetical protein